MKKVLIFGVGGFVGSYLAAEFKSHGYDVYGSDRVGVQNTPDLDGTYVCELEDADRVKSIVASVKPTHIVNLAAISNVGLSWKIPRTTVEVNVCGSLNILEAVRDTDIDTKVLLIGSSEEYDIADGPMAEDTKLNASNPYGISKVMLEQFSSVYRNYYKMKVYHVRSFNHTGVGQSDNFVIPSWCKQAAEISCSGKPGVMKVGNLNVSRDFSNVKDIVRAYRMIIESDNCGEVYNVGNGQTVPLRELLEYITKLSEQPITIETDPKLVRPIENPVIWCDHSKISKDLGWEPEYNIFETAKELFDYYVEIEKDI
ncbi:GDP-mannose 4,6-dehydratase [Butyrivibrio sp. AD3002]|uniref:GDP-mannose 4,6-dehydratase n=1 Tax=Butyrivibrio sp. AD3002 TaxID=1280670 RepID=UPI0003B4B128|nr:GDP-mannose 4,6-dehydratase [Butyrivibrio sp. AD3002]